MDGSTFETTMGLRTQKVLRYTLVSLDREWGCKVLLVFRKREVKFLKILCNNINV